MLGVDVSCKVFLVEGVVMAVLQAIITWDCRATGFTGQVNQFLVGAINHKKFQVVKFEATHLQ